MANIIQTPAAADPLAFLPDFISGQQLERRRREEEREKERQAQKQRAIIAASVVGGFVAGPALGLSGGTLGATQIGSSLSASGSVVPMMSAGIGSLQGAAAGASLAGALGVEGGSEVGSVLGSISQGVEAARERERDIVEYGRPMTPEGRLRFDIMKSELGGSAKEQRELGYNTQQYVQYLSKKERERVVKLQGERLAIAKRQVSAQEMNAGANVARQNAAADLARQAQLRQGAEDVIKAHGLKRVTPDQVNTILSQEGPEASLIFEKMGELERQQDVQEEAQKRKQLTIAARKEQFDKLAETVGAHMKPSTETFRGLSRAYKNFNEDAKLYSTDEIDFDTFNASQEDNLSSVSMGTFEQAQPQPPDPAELAVQMSRITQDSFETITLEDGSVAHVWSEYNSKSGAFEPRVEIQTEKSERVTAGGLNSQNVSPNLFFSVAKDITERLADSDEFGGEDPPASRVLAETSKHFNIAGQAARGEIKESQSFASDIDRRWRKIEQIRNGRPAHTLTGEERFELLNEVYGIIESAEKAVKANQKLTPEQEFYLDQAVQFDEFTQQQGGQ